MPAGKSPNNAFNLHKDQMQGCFYTIRRDRFDWIRYPCEELDREISKTFFYWEKCENTGIYYLYSKEGDSVDVDLVQRRQRRERYCNQRDDTLLTKVREYYTDGVRAIGAME